MIILTEENLKKILGVVLLTLLALVLLLSGCGKRAPDKISAAHILIMYQGSMKAPAEITITKAEALEQIKKIKEKIAAGADFSELAKLYSDCPSSKNGGVLSEFSRGDMVKPFEEAAFKLKVGKVSDIVETPFGYHIIKRLK